MKRNYEIYDKELLAIVEALIKWRQYLLDAIEKFEVWTDYEYLKYFWKLHKLNGCKIVSQVTRLWFHSITYSKKNKYKNKHPVKKRLSRYKKW